MQPWGLKISTETVRVPGLRPDGPFAVIKAKVVQNVNRMSER